GALRGHDTLIVLSRERGAIDSVSGSSQTARSTMTSRAQAKRGSSTTNGGPAADRAPGGARRRASRSAACLGSDSRRNALAVTVRRRLAGGAGAVSVDREISDRRRGPAQRALWIVTQPDLAEAHAERVVGEEAADQRFADAEQELDGLSRLNRSNHSWEHAQDAGLASGGDEPGRGRRRIEAAIAGARVGREDRRHA